MSEILKKLGERRRDSIWCFILGLLFLGYAWSILEGGQFLIDNNAPLIIMVTTSVTVLLLGIFFGGSGIVLLLHGMVVLVGEGS